MSERVCVAVRVAERVLVLVRVGVAERVLVRVRVWVAVRVLVRVADAVRVALMVALRGMDVGGMWSARGAPTTEGSDDHCMTCAVR